MQEWQEMLYCYRRPKLGNAKTIASIVRSISPNHDYSSHNGRFVKVGIAQFFIQSTQTFFLKM